MKKMKKSCNRCKALSHDFRTGYYCQLGHLIECTKEVAGKEVQFRPLEDCEKPLTEMELIIWYNERRK